MEDAMSTVELNSHRTTPDSPEPTTRILTSTRVVALALITVLVIGLMYVRLAPGLDPVVVPEGARAGDLILEPCEYATEDGDYAADCGTLVVPETRTDPESRLIALPVTRIRAISEDPKEPVFFLTGGPGQSNMDWFQLANRYVGDRDFVLVGYRGIDGSVRLDCPEVESALKRSTDVLSGEFFRAYGDGYRSCADRLTNEGVDLASYGQVQQIEDLETARVALGYDRINLLSESAGTRTAMIYAWRYPESIHRSVMVSVNPPGNFLLDPETTDEQIGRYAALCAGDDSCRTRTDDLAATMRQITADIPDRWLFLPIKGSNVKVMAPFGLLDSTPAASPTPAPMTVDAWLSAAEGDASGFWFSSVFADLLFPELFVRGQYAAAAILDAQAARDYFAAGQGDLTNLGRAATAFTWGGGSLADSWPAAPDEDSYRRVQASQVETLLISGDLDPMAPPQPATTQLLPHLPNGHQVVLPGFGHQGTVFHEQPEAGSRLINTFFDSGHVDDSLYVPANLDFTPSLTFGAIAKTALGVMLALVALTALSLLGMARRVRTRGRIGPKSAALLRSVNPLVLGLGGWCLGALIVLTTLPGVRIDNQLLVIVSVGVPIGLGIYWAWVHRAFSAPSKQVGIAAAAAGALTGAWLGFHATDAPLAVLTAIVGAIAGANLALILLDMSRARSTRSRSAATTTTANATSKGVPT
jgi:pimeloyl-ACP methyl ester carboxylesterase